MPEMSYSLLLPGPKLQPNQGALGVGKVANDLSKGLRELPDECRNGKNLIFLGKPRIDQ
jgi:hypothetical protein